MDDKLMIPQDLAGPWTDVDRDDGTHIIPVGNHVDRNPPTICIVPHGDEADETDKVVRLLGSAPDFAAACTPDRLDALELLIAGEEMSGHYDSDLTDSARALLADLRAAMNKATGGKP